MLAEKSCNAPEDLDLKELRGVEVRIILKDA
jgi:hypothetical protein